MMGLEVRSESDQTGGGGDGFEMVQVHYIYVHFISIIITLQYMMK